MKKLITGSKENLLFLLFSVTGMLVAIFNNSLLANYFSLREFGSYQLLITYLGVLVIFNLTGFDAYIQKTHLKGDAQYFYHVLKRILPVALLLLLVLLLIVNILKFENRLVINLAFIITMVSIFDKLACVLEITRKFKYLRYVELLIKLTFLGLTYATILSNLSLETYLIGFSMLYLLQAMIKILLSLSLVGNSTLVNVSDRKSTDRDALKRVVSISYATIAVWIERLILGFMDPALLAIFSIGYLVPRLAKDNIKTLLKPTIFSWVGLPPKQFKHKLIKHTPMLLFFGVVAAGAICLLMQPFINLFFSKFEDSVLISQILSLQLVFVFLIYSMAAFLTYTEHTAKVNFIENTSNTLKLVLSVCLVPTFLIEGALLSVILSEGIRQFLYYNCFRKVTAD